MDVLPGSLINEVVRVGATVRRRMLLPADRSFSEAVLLRLEAAAYPATPRFLGHDDEGRQVLSWVEGEVRSGVGAFDGDVEGILRLVRRFHELEPGVCHNDLAPRNTVWTPSGEPVFIDWDLCAPGDPLADVAHVCWQFLGLGPGRDAENVAPRLASAADAYGLDHERRRALVDQILRWQQQSADGIEGGAAAGRVPMRVLVDRGAVEEIRAARAWVVRHRAVLDAALG